MEALLVAADVVRAAAFIGLVFVGSLEATVALALLAGTDNAILNPTVMAALPGFFGQRRFAAATPLHNAIREVGFTAGPALATLAFVVVRTPDFWFWRKPFRSRSRLQSQSRRPDEAVGTPTGTRARALGEETSAARAPVRRLLLSNFISDQYRFPTTCSDNIANP